MKSFGQQSIHHLLLALISLHASQECFGFVQNHKKPAMWSAGTGTKSSVAWDMEDTINNNQVKTLYDILGARPTATKQELKTHYVRLAKLTHPDALISNGGAVTIGEGPDFAEVVTAWKVLADPKTRKRYDRELRAKEFTDMAQKFANDRLEEAIPAMAAIMDRLTEPLLSNNAWNNRQQPEMAMESTGSQETGWFDSLFDSAFESMPPKMEEIIGGFDQKMPYFANPFESVDTENESRETGWVESMASKVVDMLTEVLGQAAFPALAFEHPESVSKGTDATEGPGWMSRFINDSALILSKLADVVTTKVQRALWPEDQGVENPLMGTK